MCFYDKSLWKYYKVGSMNKLAAAYIKCVKIFFGYAKFSSVTVMLLDLGLPASPHCSIMLVSVSLPD